MQDNTRRARTRGTDPGTLRLGVAVFLDRLGRPPLSDFVVVAGLCLALVGCGGTARTDIAPAKSEVRHSHEVDRPVRTSRLKIRLAAPGEPAPAGEGGRP